MRRLAVAILLSASLGSCGNGTHSLRVDLRTDLVPGAEIDSVRVVLDDGETLTHDVDPNADYVGGIRVAIFEGLPSGGVRARVSVLFGDVEILARPVTLQLEGDSAVTVVLTRDCRGVTCPDSGDAAQAACLGGRCVDETCTEEALAMCEEPECMADVDCPAASACSSALCVAGTCLYADQDMCAAGEYCDADRGCLAVPISGPGAIAVTALSALWTTPNSMRLAWRMEGDAAEFRELRVELGKDREAFSRVVTGEENPELHSFMITERDLTQATTIFGLEPDSLVLVRLIAIDTQGRSQETEIIETHTPLATTDSIVVFADAETAGFSIPANFERSTTEAFAGTHSYEATHMCADTDAACWEIYRRQGLAQPLSEISADRAQGAYLEWSAQIEAADAQHSLYSSIRIAIGNDGARRLYAAEGYAIRGDGAYRTYQWPLHQLFDMGEGIDIAALQGNLHEFGIGGMFDVGVIIRWDEVRIHY